MNHFGVKLNAFFSYSGIRGPERMNSVCTNAASASDVVAFFFG